MCHNTKCALKNIAKRQYERARNRLPTNTSLCAAPLILSKFSPIEATHNFKWIKIICICLIWDQTFGILECLNTHNEISFQWLWFNLLIKQIDKWL